MIQEHDSAMKLGTSKVLVTKEFYEEWLLDWLNNDDVEWRRCNGKLGSILESNNEVLIEFTGVANVEEYIDKLINREKIITTLETDIRNGQCGTKNTT